VPGATITRGFFPHSRENGQATLPSALSCTTWGFSCGYACAKPGGLLPRLFNLTRHYPCAILTRVFTRYTNGAKVVLGGIFSVTLSVARDLHLGRPRFHEACRLMVFGLSSGKTGVKPAIARHGRHYSMEPHRLPASPQKSPAGSSDELIAGGNAEKRRKCREGVNCKRFSCSGCRSPRERIPIGVDRFYGETGEICANLFVHFPGDSGTGFQEKSLARNRKTNIVHAPPRLAEVRVMLPERLF
jgi:hypothetical protein